MVRRGFTLIELMVGIALGSLIVMAAVGFAGHQVTTLGRSNQTLEMTQVGRAALDMMADDVLHAGVGVGYQSDGTFAGIVTTGAFLRHGVNFDGDNRAITLNEGNALVATTTDDLSVALADGEEITIVAYDPGAQTGQICAPADGGVRLFENPTAKVVMRDQFGLAARSALMTTTTPVPSGGTTPCQNGASCEVNGATMGCMDVQFAADPQNLFETDAAAANANYEGGAVAPGFRQVTWFVSALATGRSELRRVSSDDLLCAGLGDPTCGTIIADDVDAIHYRVYTFTGGAWTDVTNVGGAILTRDPIRVDLELVVRARAADPEGRPHSMPTFVLEGNVCEFGGAPPCVSSVVERAVFRTSVELKNSGYMSYL